MLRMHHGKIHVKRRDFLKTTAIAGIAASTPGITAFRQNQAVTDSYYEKLADALNKLPNSFPRTKSNIEILLLKKIFLPEEANIAGQLTGKPETMDIIQSQSAVKSDRIGSQHKECCTGTGLISSGNFFAPLYTRFISSISF